jgi:hypothetical protein
MPLCSTTRRHALALASSVVALLAVPAPAAAAKAPKELDGLERIKSRRVQYLYVRPGATLAAYKRIKLDATTVSFEKYKDANRDPSRQPTKSDMDAIRTGLAAEFARIFAEELAKGGYALTDDSDDDVLRVVPGIYDLYIAAPGAMVPMGRVMVAEASRMTLVAELRDSVTGQLLARVGDRQEVAPAGGVEVGTRDWKSAAAGRVIARWAGVLRKGLDEARGQPAAK